MRAIVFGIGLMVVISAIAAVGLDRLDLSAETQYTSPNDSVRLR